jgi:Rrf2 family transcriptional regulator, iron-sulfur cluster assembly transcription factor
MKITAQEEYGLRCLLQLARHHEAASPITVREIASSEGISVAYAEKLLHRLAKSGLAASVRGVKGGFRLRRSPEQVTVGDAVRALGNFLTHAAICQRYTGDESRCVHNKDCGLRPVWSTVNYHLQRLLDNLPLSTLLQGEREARQQIMEMAPLPLAPSPRMQKTGGAS